MLYIYLYQHHCVYINELYTIMIKMSIIILKEGEKMDNIEEMARKMRNQKAKEWRDKNKEKVKEINRRYWINKAKKELEKKED